MEGPGDSNSNLALQLHHALCHDSVALQALREFEPNYLEQELINSLARNQTPEWLFRERFELFVKTVPRIDAAKEQVGQDVIPLSALHLELTELWRVYLPLALLIRDMVARERQRSNKAFVLGINAPAGAGKSTLVQILKFLLSSIGGGLRCVAVSQDDFYRTRKERRAKGIPNRFELAGMDVELCRSVLCQLRDNDADGEITIPRFSKARDDREPTGTIVKGHVDVVLYEGWRVSIDQDDYRCLISLPDYLICLTGDLDLLKRWKFEQAERDAIAIGKSFDREALQAVWDHYVVPTVKEFSGDVVKRSDLVLEEELSHLISAVHGRFHQNCHQTHPHLFWS